MRLSSGRGAFAVAMVILGVALADVLAQQWQTGKGFRYAEITPSHVRTGFTLMSNSVRFTNFLGEERSLTNQIYHNGSGVALGDVDGDGLCDIYFGNIDGPNALYRNLGNWKFEDITARAGVACAGLDTTGVLFADIDGDGDLDLLVNAIGRGTAVFTNDGAGIFRESTASSGTQSRKGTTSLAMADVDGDGDLDLYVTNYRTVTLRDEPFTRFSIKVVNGKPEVAAVNGRPATEPDLIGRFGVGENGAIIEFGEPDVLFRNDGAGRFTAIPWTDGTFLDEDGRRMTLPYDFGLSVMLRDLNHDGAPDIYVCNDFESPDRIWLNDGKGRFRAAPTLMFRQTSVFSMGVDVADIDRDGFDDIFVVDMLSREHERRMVQLGDRRGVVSKPGQIANRPQYMHNTLFWNRGDGTYAEVARYSGLEATDWSWTPIFLDVDLDGFEDVLVTNGHERDAQNVDYARRVEALKKQRQMNAIEQLRLRKIYPRLENSACAFRNRGGLRFEDTSHEWNFEAKGAKQGLALADLDNDGDLDAVLNCLNAPALLYRNDSAAPRVQVRLKGKSPNTRGVGAKIRVLGGPVTQTQDMLCGGRFLSGDDFVRTFAAGTNSAGLTIEVTWRSGARSVVSGAKANRIYEIQEELAAPITAPTPKPEVLPLFQDVSERIAHTHHEEDFNDFERQPLLARKLSQQGPGVTWFDLDNDGKDDLLIGTGRGGALAAFRNKGNGAFDPMRNGAYSEASLAEYTSLLGHRTKAGAEVLAVESHYEDGETNVRAGQVIDAHSANSSGELPAMAAALGSAALGDVDGDGTLELFLGGRVSPARYPASVSSGLLRRERGRWTIDTQRSLVFQNVGMVTSARFTDLSSDGAPDLVLATEWGPVLLFRNEKGELKPWHRPELDQLTGWWNSVATGDFDGDGRMDIVAGNWGENTSYQRYAPEPIEIVHGDFDGNGVYDVLEAALDPQLKKVVPIRDSSVVAGALPQLAARFSNYTEYGQADLTKVLGGAQHQKRTAKTLQTMVFLNRGDRFEPKPLPLEAQLSPVFGMAVADFDGDGHQDLALAQNFFAVEPMTSRYDAGRGLLLLGDGKGSFRAVPAKQSGIEVYGEGRGLAVADFDEDGRVDFVMGQNGAATKLYRNQSGRSGLRVRIAGAGDNPLAIGAQVRGVRSNGALTPVQEVQAGGGWLSQDSATLILAINPPLEAIEVRWPGGKITRTPLVGGQTITVNSSGKLEPAR